MSIAISVIIVGKNNVEVRKKCVNIKLLNLSTREKAENENNKVDMLSKIEKLKMEMIFKI